MYISFAATLCTHLHPPEHDVLSQDADSDTRVVRRIRRDTVERGRTLDSIMLQYETFVKPMHAEWVGPSKTKADVIVNSENGHSTQIALDMLSNHLKVAGGIPLAEEDGTEQKR
jgi:uridine kinase